MTEVVNKMVVLESYPKDKISEDIFKVTNAPVITELKDGNVLLKLVGLSVDPYMRGKFKKGTGNPSAAYIEQSFPLDQPIISGGLAIVVQSKNEKYNVGEYVASFSFPWQNVFEVDPTTTSLTLAPQHYDLSQYYKFLFPFNIAPLTAWLPIRQFWPKESITKQNVTAYVSGAAGAVGTIAGQILKKLYGFSYVIGSAGSDDKVKYLIETLGYDAAFNYKKESPYVALPRLAPNKIDYFFDNVGGTTLDAALPSMAFGGKIISCGAIEVYDNAETSANMKNLFHIVVNAVTIQGFLLNQFYEFVDVGNQEIMEWSKSGVLISEETYIDGIENAPKALVGLFSGANTGKMMVRVVTEGIHNNYIKNNEMGKIALNDTNFLHNEKLESYF